MERFVCPLCGWETAPGPEPCSCPTCQVPLRWERRVQPGDRAFLGRGVWRYRPLLPEGEPVTLGEGGTPLVRAPNPWGIELWWKLEFLNPTGSFKDRGAAVMVAMLRTCGAEVLVDDSSGNAGAALAAYCARAGLRAKLFVPAYASGPKLRQIEAYGAELVRVPGPRSAASEAAQEACARDPRLIYASHNASPYFVAGLQTLAFEMAEDLGWHAPDHVVVPLGGGGLFLGLVYGFALLVRLEHLEKMPRVHVAQAEACAPIVRALAQGLPEPAPVASGETVAEGARIPRPERGREILKAALLAGTVGVMVSEEEILATQKGLARAGLYVEPTAALAPAALPKLIQAGVIRPGETVVVPLTGFGLKAG
ncbi:MAG: pyridoxal-phosphate dependent enzyme [Candidatus Bipolaricaulaceae bacterium]